jgi:hypothetical protein
LVYFEYAMSQWTILILPISAQNIKMGDQDTKTANGTKGKKKIRQHKNVLQKLGMRSGVPNMLAFLVSLMAPSRCLQTG